MIATVCRGSYALGSMERSLGRGNEPVAEGAEEAAFLAAMAGKAVLAGADGAERANGAGMPEEYDLFAGDEFLEAVILEFIEATHRLVGGKFVDPRRLLRAVDDGTLVAEQTDQFDVLGIPRLAHARAIGVVFELGGAVAG